MICRPAGDLELPSKVVSGTGNLSSGVARNLQQGVCKVILPIPSPSFPFPPLFPSPSFPLEVGPLNTARGSGGVL